MPVIGRFYGVTIKMYFRQKEHEPPHIHAIYGEYIGMFSIYDGKMYNGDLPLREQKFVEAFIMYYRERLLQMWEKQDFELLPLIE